MLQVAHVNLQTTDAKSVSQQATLELSISKCHLKIKLWHAYDSNGQAAPVMQGYTAVLLQGGKETDSAHRMLQMLLSCVTPALVLAMQPTSTCSRQTGKLLLRYNLT